jgi:pullulanase
MKKILFMGLMLLTVFTFVACGGITTGTTTGSVTTDGTTLDSTTTQQTTNPTTQAPTTTQKTTIVDPDSPKIFIHYYRFNADYTDWNIWGWQNKPTSLDGAAYYFEDDDTAVEYNFGGKVTVININETFPEITKLGLIVRKGNWTAKDIDADRFVDIPAMGQNEEFHIYLVEGDERIGTFLGDPDGPSKNPKLKYAYFTDLDVIKFEGTENLVAESIVVKADDVSQEILERNVLGAIGTVTLVDEIDFSKVYTVEATFSDTITRSFPVTFDGIYDSAEFELAFGYEGDDLGAIVNETNTSFRLWAPVSQSVTLNIYDTGTPEEFGGTDTPIATYEMVKSEKGTFYHVEEGNLHGKYYTYTVNNGGTEAEVVDPYAKSAGVNGLRGMVVDFAQLNPVGFEYDFRADNMENVTDAIIYELHVRDLTSHSSWNGTEENRGKFLGLVESGTTFGMYRTGFDHIVDLGVTHVQILPFFDFGNAIDESKLDEVGYNSFNWGYMPLNFNAPEGSYSSDPYDGETRVRELKQMIMEFNQAGIRINMDVVYNHHGETANSNFELIVPGYYFRKTATGAFSNGSGTGNETASERFMMRKFMLDSLTFWAEEYNISGFRFDLMALHDVDTMNMIVDALHLIDPTIMVYGEPWMGGTSPLSAELQAGKANLYKMPDVAAFNDDLRDGVKGSVFGSTLGGFVQGVYSIAGVDTMARVRYGIVGGIAHPYIEPSKLSAQKVWHTVPTKTINYVTAHDNNTLHDKLYMSLDEIGYLELLNALQKQSNAIVLTSQGIAFLHAGDEILRSKPLVDRVGFDHNSYQSPDAVNQIRWDSLEDPEVQDMYDYYKGLIALRKAHSSFRMTETQDVIDSLDFIYTDVAGMIAFEVDNLISGDTAESILVFHNSNKAEVNITLAEGATYYLVVNEEFAGTETLETFTSGQTISIAANSTYVILVDYDNR